MVREAIVPLGSRPGFAETWESSQESMECSFFTSAIWIRTWANLLPNPRRAWIFEIKDQAEIQSLGLLVRSTDWIGRVLPVRRFWLHATGRTPLDDLTVEFNGLPSRAAVKGHAESSLLAALGRLPGKWDQLMIPHSAHAGRWAAAAEAQGYAVRSRSHECFHVDLDSLRREGRDYESVLSKKTRYLLRRSRREIETEYGPVAVQEAASIEEAEAFFQRLTELHQQHWNGRGRTGAFADATIASFHRSLLRSPSGLVTCKLLRVHSGAMDVGYLYVFVWRRIAYFYQSGFNYQGIGRERSPGYVTIASAIEYLRASELSRFEFLAGENLYKSRLGTGSSQLHSLEIQRRSLRNSLLNGVRAFRNVVTSGDRDRRTIGQDAGAA